MRRTSSSIGPTAHYTGAVWARRGLSHPALETSTGKLMYWSAWPATTLARELSGTGLEEVLWARHVLIDRLLEAAIERGEISQVIELAAGMSPRGWRLCARHGEHLDYVETDLRAMAERKRQALESAGSLGPRHRVEVVDALSGSGAESLEGLAARLDPSRGLAIVAEGLLSYLDRESVLSLWRRSATVLADFPQGLMLCDLHLAGENKGLIATIGVLALSAFVRGQVAMHFEDEAEAVAALEAVGFRKAVSHRGTEVSDERGAASIHVIEAIA
jgi:O-methyltransferase involved in polyketide biosynthesis